MTDSLAGRVVLVSFGAGTNSTAMLIEMVERGVHVDAILFADTGGERPETYEFLASFSAWLVERGYPAIIVVRHTLRDGTFESLEQECLNKKRLPSVAYGFKKCSGKLKIEPQTKWTNHWPLARAAWKRRERIVKLVGFGIDERHRADKGDTYSSDEWYALWKSGATTRAIAETVARDKSDPKEMRSLIRRVSEAVRYEKRYLLIEWGMGRDECVTTIDRTGIRRPGKSACFFCSSSKLAEIRALTPDLRDRSLAMEANAAGTLTSIRGLGRSFAWRDVIYPAQQALSFEAPVSLPCECTDGDEDEVAA